MKTRAITLTGAIVLIVALVIVYFWRHQDSPVHQDRPTQRTGNEVPVDDEPSNEPDYKARDLSLEQARWAWKRLFKLDLPAGTKFVQDGHFILPKDEVPGLIEFFRKLYIDEGDRIPSKWIQMTSNRYREEGSPARSIWKFPAGSYGLSVVPHWPDQLPFKEYGFSIDPTTGRMVFGSLDNYDP